MVYIPTFIYFACFLIPRGCLLLPNKQSSFDNWNVYSHCTSSNNIYQTIFRKWEK